MGVNRARIMNSILLAHCRRDFTSFTFISMEKKLLAYLMIFFVWDSGVIGSVCSEWWVQWSWRPRILHIRFKTAAAGLPELLLL